jgi:hypothetical protein
MVGGTNREAVWVHESNQGDADVFDVSVLRQALTELSATTAGIRRVYVHDAASRVKFDIEFESVTHVIAMDQDTYVAELEGLGSVVEVDKQFVRKAIESRGPLNPVKVAIQMDREQLTPRSMVAWYVKSVVVTRGYNPSRWDGVPFQSGTQVTKPHIAPVDWKWADWKTA